MRWYWRETWLLKLIQINLFCNETLIITFISLWVRKAKCFQATPPWTGYERNTQASLQTQHTNVHTRKANTGIRLIYMGVSAVSKATNTHFEIRFLHRLPGKMHSFFFKKNNTSDSTGSMDASVYLKKLWFSTQTFHSLLAARWFSSLNPTVLSNCSVYQAQYQWEKKRFLNSKKGTLIK